MSESPILVKLGGNELAKPDFVSRFAETIAHMQTQKPCIVVHGGGTTISGMLRSIGLDPTFNQNGQRVTDPPTMEIVELVLSGGINKLLVRALVRQNIDALGLSGVDRGLITVEPWSEDMGLVGRVVHVRSEILLDLCNQGVVPVISPVSLGPKGTYNVNADHAAGAIAGAVNAQKAIFITNVPGVKINDDVAASLTVDEVKALTAAGTIYGGMIPKTEAALNAVAQGAQSAVITNLPGLEAGTGTVFTQ